MKKLFIIIFFIGFNCFSQKTIKESFTFNSKKINYFYTSFRNNYQTSFYVIINSKEKKDEIIKKVKGVDKPKSKIFFLTIPAYIINQDEKEKLIFEFIINILKRKLLDYDMNIISDYNYFKLYEEIRKVDNGKYKYQYLNAIKNLVILKNGEEAIEKID